ncbi:MAG TPA: choice-of-anchor Q domain-containing protein [Puia sp.]|nr:choice-of-anchor Q domain-containing protein [Puia sp.]
MSRILVFFFCWFSSPVFANILVIGEGHGSVVKADMKGLRSGDTLAITPGIYSDGATFTGLRNITIINYKGLVQFGKSLHIGNLSNVCISGTGASGIFYGFLFKDIRADVFFIDHKCYGLRISNCEYSNVDGMAINASNFFTTYTGDSSTLAMFKTTIANQHLIKSGGLLVGSWAPVTSFQNIIDSIAIYNIIIDSTISDVCQVLGSSIYRLYAHDWTIKGGCPNGKHDAGIFQMNGNGTICNIYRLGGFGYLWRIWNVGLNGRAESYLYNCIDLSTDHYGTIDTRIEESDTTTNNTIPFLRGGSMHIFNNTSGNKRISGNYVSVLVVAGVFFSQNGYKLEVRNNLSFNNKTDNANPIIKQNTPDPLSDTSNNLYVDDPIESEVLADTIDCFIAENSPAIDNGVPIPIVKTDIAGIVRPKGDGYDIGAREFNGRKSTSREHVAGVGRKLLWIFFLLALVIAVVIWVKKLRSGRQIKKTFLL